MCERDSNDDLLRGNELSHRRAQGHHAQSYLTGLYKGNQAARAPGEGATSESFTRPDAYLN